MWHEKEKKKRARVIMLCCVTEWRKGVKKNKKIRIRMTCGQLEELHRQY